MDDPTCDLLETILENFGLAMSEEDIRDLSEYLVEELDRRELIIANKDELR